MIVFGSTVGFCSFLRSQDSACPLYIMTVQLFCRLRYLVGT